MKPRAKNFLRFFTLGILFIGAVIPITADAQAGPIASAAASVATYALNWVGNLAAEGIAWLLVQIVWVLIWMMAAILGMVGFMFDFVVSELVLGMGKYVNSASADGVRIAWTIMRDLANIGIIGGLVAAAFGTILNLSKINANKFLARLIVAALLVNFSYFFAGAMIDISNFAAGAVYRSAVAEAGCKDCSIAVTFMNLTNFKSVQGMGYVLATLTSPVTGAPTSHGLTSNVAELVEKLMFLILMCVTIYVFLSAIALLVGRFVALILLLISSPLGIAGLAIPGVEKYAKEWWDALFSQALFAPVYFLLVGISLKILSGTVGAIQAALATSGSVSLVGIFISFLIAIIFMILSLRVAKEMSSQAKRLSDVYKGADKLAGWLPKAYSTGVRTTLQYGGAVAARNTIGYAAERFEHQYREWAGKNRFDQKGMLVRSADLAAKKTLEGLAGRKWLGYEGYAPVRKQRLAREVELGNVEAEEKKKEELWGHLSGTERSKLNKLYSKARAGTMTEQERAEFKKLAGDGHALGTMVEAEEKYRKAYEAGTERLKISDQELHDSLVKKEAAGTLTKQEKTVLDDFKIKLAAGGALGKDKRAETEAEYWARQESLGDLGRRKGTRKQNADKTWEGDGEEMGAYYERLDGAKILEEAQQKRLNELRAKGSTLTAPEQDEMKKLLAEKTTSYREARTNAQEIFASLPEGFLEREYEKDPESIASLASVLPEGQWLEILKNKHVRRDIKNKMWADRRGEYARMLKNVQDKVDRGELVEGSDEYKAQILVPYNYAARYIKHDEFKEMILSDAEFAKDEKGQSIRFEDLRGPTYRNVLWQGSLSGAFASVKQSRILGDTAQRDASKAKRLTMDVLRDQQAGAYVVLGYEGDEDYLPFEDGTVNYHAAERAQNWAKNRAQAMERIIANYNSAPDHKGISDSDYKTAKEDLRYAQMIKDGPAKNPFAAKISVAQASVSAADIEAAKADPYFEGMSDTQITTEVKEDKKAGVIQAARARYAQAEKDGTFKDAARREAFLADDENFFVHRLVQTEKGAEGWFKGKNTDEVKAILNKRSWWSTETAYGMDAEKLGALAGQDGAERVAFFDNLLMRGSDALISNYMINDELRSLFPWPNPDRMKKINRVRRSEGKEPLPVDPFKDQKNTN